MIKQDLQFIGKNMIFFKDKSIIYFTYYYFFTLHIILHIYITYFFF